VTPINESITGCSGILRCKELVQHQEYGGPGPSSVRKGRASGRRNDILHPRVFSVTGPVQEYDELGPSTIPGISTRTVVRIEETKLLDHSAQIISICLSMPYKVKGGKKTITAISVSKKNTREMEYNS